MIAKLILSVKFMGAKKMPKICGSQTKKSVLLWEGRAREPHRGLSMPFS
jgi:hypothetical protein